MTLGAPATAGAATPRGATTRRRIPAGYAHVDPRTATRVPLTMSLREGVPLYPGDPELAWEVVTDTRTPAHDDGGYLLERVTSLGTHTASHISAPVHFILGGRAARPARRGLHAHAPRGDRRAPSHPRHRARLRRHPARISAPGNVATGASPPAAACCCSPVTRRCSTRAADRDSPYVTTPAPGFAGAAVDWLFGARSILATGSDTLGPDATVDTALQATTRTLLHGGITLENVGPQPLPHAPPRRLDRRQRQPAGVQRLPDGVHRVHVVPLTSTA